MQTLAELFTEAIRGEIPMETFYNVLSRANPEEVIAARSDWVEWGVDSDWLRQTNIYKNTVAQLIREGHKIIDEPYNPYLHTRFDLLGFRDTRLSRNEIVRWIFNNLTYPETILAAVHILEEYEKHDLLSRDGLADHKTAQEYKRKLKSLVDSFSPRDYDLLVLEQAVFRMHSVEKSREVLAELLK